MVRRVARAALEILRLTFARDTLGGTPTSAAPAENPPPHRFLRMLFAIEPLPMDAPAPSARRAPQHALFGIERLPVDPPAPPRRRGPSLLSLLAPEPLPRDPVPAAPRRPSRLAALFAPEKLDDPK